MRSPHLCLLFVDVVVVTAAVAAAVAVGEISLRSVTDRWECWDECANFCDRGGGLAEIFFLEKEMLGGGGGGVAGWVGTIRDWIGVMNCIGEGVKGGQEVDRVGG